jgi:hypothetical protein
MIVVHTNPTKLRLWPGVAIVVLQWVARFGIPLVVPEFTQYGVMAGLAGGLALIVWWLFFSRAPWADRLGALAVIGVAMGATWPFLDASIATGAMGFIFPILAVPGLCLGFVLWAAMCGHLPDGPRRLTMAAAVLLACGAWTLVRTGGFTGSFDNDLAWRWSATPEQRLLAQAEETVPAPQPSTAGAREAPRT